MKNINSELLFKFFSNSATPEEERLVNMWIDESEENKNAYNNASDLYEAYLLEACSKSRTPQAASVFSSSERRRSRIWRVFGTALVSAAAVALFCVFGYNIIENRLEAQLAATMNTIAVPAGKSMDYILSDGTLIKLNSGARLQYPMSFANDHREVRLSGEAYFDVAHNPEKPFIVRTFVSDITVLGTKFNVNADEAGGAFSTTLLEGSVRLTNNCNGKEILLKPDQTAKMADGKFVVESVTAKSAIRWTEGVINIGGLDFAALMKKLETAFGVKIVIESDTMPELEYTDGEIRISDGIDNALKVLKNGADFNYRKDYNDGTIYIR